MADKILVVDDDPDTVKYISIFLKSQGYEVLEALDGMTALKLAHERHPDVVILDVMMPNLDGYEVARRLRRTPDTAQIPILMFTAKSQTQDKLDGYNAGVDIYLAKPAHPVELNANIKALLAQSKVRKTELANKGFVLGVIAAKGGLGVSTVTLNLAISFARITKKKVVAMETRPGQSTWRNELGFADASGLDNLLAKNLGEINQNAVKEQLTPNTFGVPLLLASNNVNDITAYTAVDQYEMILENLSALADLVVVDIGTNFHPAYEVFTRLCNEIIVITEPQPLTLRHTRHLVADLKTRNFGSAKLLTIITVNRVRADMSFSVTKIEEILGHSVSLGFIPAPEQAFLAADRSTPLYLVQPEGQTAKQFDILAEMIAKHTQPE
jgi:DNA-binding response OmpR family regulator